MSEVNKSPLALRFTLEMGFMGMTQIILTPNSFRRGMSFVNALKVPCGEYCLILAS